MARCVSSALRPRQICFRGILPRTSETSAICSFLQHMFTLNGSVLLGRISTSPFGYKPLISSSCRRPCFCLSTHRLGYSPCIRAWHPTHRFHRTHPGMWFAVLRVPHRHSTLCSAADNRSSVSGAKGSLQGLGYYWKRALSRLRLSQTASPLACLIPEVRAGRMLTKQCNWCVIEDVTTNFSGNSSSGSGRLSYSSGFLISRYPRPPSCTNG